MLKWTNVRLNENVVINSLQYIFYIIQTLGSNTSVLSSRFPSGLPVPWSEFWAQEGMFLGTLPQGQTLLCGFWSSGHKEYFLLRSLHSKGLFGTVQFSFPRKQVLKVNATQHPMPVRNVILKHDVVFSTFLIDQTFPLTLFVLFLSFFF